MEPHDLYGLPLEQFTERRNALARELRRDGRRDEAATLAKLRKPSVAAWAVNQLVRTQRGEVDALFSAGDALARAQADLLKNKGEAGALRAAVDAERAAVELLTEKARGLLNADGHELTPARLEQVAETLHAAALDEDARTKVEDGCLERELRHIGLGPTATGTARARPRRAARRDSRAEKAANSRRLERAKRELLVAESRRARAADELRDAEAAVAAARERVAEAEQD
jgi:hypothetical protein